MSDFVSGFWLWYVAIITLVSITACGVLLWLTDKTKVQSAADNTTGHVWDGDLCEMNNPLPRWWKWMFVITVVFAFAYAALYPTLGVSDGKLGWSSAGQHAAEVQQVKDSIAPLYAKFTGMPPEELAKDSQALAIGERLYLNNCAQCHGSDARGSKSFPNLTDNDWLGDGTVAHIKNTITNGRQGMMPPMAAAVGSPEDVRNLAQYVLSLSGSPHDSVQAALGKPKFGVCAACHGPEGKGMAATGAPNLTDQIWLHGYGAEAIIKMVNEGKNNVMPAQNVILTPEQIHVLTGYVWNLSRSAKPL